MIKILIADDHAIVRSGLRQIVATTSDIVVQAEAADGQEVLARLRETVPDVLLLDLSMPGISGTDLIRRIRSEHENLAILVLTMHNEGQFASRALRSGATGYMTKDSDPGVLLAGIRKVHAGGKFIDPSLVDAMIFHANGDDAPPHRLLSDREFQVLQQLAGGRTINEIADAYALSAKTISTHKMRLMKKLGISNNSELVRYAVNHGLVQ